MFRTRAVAAISGIAGMLAAVVVAFPAAAAAPSGTTTIDFADGTLGTWSANGSPTLAYVADPDDATNQVLSVSGRTSGYFGIQSPVGAFDEGVEYTVTARVRTAGVSGAAHFTYNEPGADNEYSWVGNTDTGTASTWKTVTGTFTPGANAASAKLYMEVEGLVDYSIDDIAITGSGGTEPCVPTATSVTSLDFADGTLGTWSANGSPTLAYVADPDDATNQVLSVSGRTSGYFGIQSPVGAFDEGVEYTVTARVRTAGVSGAAHFTYNEPGADNEYSWVGNTDTGTASTWKTVTGTFTPGANAASAKLYMEVEGLVDYSIDDVSVTYLSTCSDGPAPGTVAISTDFEDGIGGWEARDSGSGAPTVDVTTADAHGGSQAALVSDRTSQGSGLRYNVTDALVAGTTYELTAWVKFAGSPTDNVWLSLQNTTGDSTTYSTLGQFTGMSSDDWVQVSQKFTMPATDEAYVYFETSYGNTNTTSFMVDDINVVVPVPPVVQDITPLKDTLPFPLGVAIDSRETTGSSADLLLKHFDQVTPENYMKPEAWYNADGEFSPSPEIDTLMNFAQANAIRVYGHVLVWHSQTPDWFFQHDDGTPLTSSDADKQILRDRMHDHIFAVAKYLSDNWGAFGSSTNPLVSFDVANETVDDSSQYADGLRRSPWYNVLGEEYLDDAFNFANEAFNDTYADASATHPIQLFINDYNTEQAGKQGRYHALVERLLSRNVPIDGVGHQFHLSLSTPVATLGAALDAFEDTGLKQAVTEFDVTTGTPVSKAKLIDQGYYYRDAFRIFRDHADDMFSVTVWGLIDSRSWRDDSGAPLIFDDGLQAKPAYDGIIDDGSLAAPLRTADVFAGDVALDGDATTAPEWSRLPLLPAGANAQFQLRWAADHLTAYVTVADATADDTDGVTFSVGSDTYQVGRDGSGDVDAVATETSGGYTLVAHLPVTAAKGDTEPFDVQVTDGDNTDGWNSPGVLGTLTLVESLSHVDVPEAAIVPTIDGTLDPVWSTSSSVQTVKQVSGTDGAIGTFHLLWKGQTLYVLAEVADPTVDTSGSDPWTKDSVEIYVDGGNAKNGSYRYDDTQIRINADNGLSFGTGDETYQANRVQSATKKVDGGYVVEAAISLLEYCGLGTVQGLDVQVNDATGGARTAIRNWADPTGTGYQTTARWGVASLVEGTLIDQAFTPAIIGSAIVGSTLKVSGLPKGTTLTYQWLRNGSPIAGASHSTYKLAKADGGTKISVRVTSVATGYNTLTKTSGKTPTVLKVFSKVTTPTIAGFVIAGHTISAKIHAWSPSAKYHFQWYSNGKAIKGATGSTLKLTRYQAGTTVTVKVTGSRSGYLSVSKVSAGKKVPLLHFVVWPSRFNGPTRVGGTLRATPGASFPVTTSKTYQWYSNGKAVSGATKSTYVVKSADKGKRISVKITFRATGYATRVFMVGPSYRITAAH